MLITWLDCWTFFGKFSLESLDVFFQGQTLFWPNLRNGSSDWCETKISASVGYWVYYMTLTMTLKFQGQISK